MTRARYRMDPQPPVDLPGHLRHGSLTAYNRPYSCRCEECLEARRSYDRTLWEIKNRQKQRKERKNP